MVNIFLMDRFINFDDKCRAMSNSEKVKGEVKKCLALFGFLSKRGFV